MATELENLVVRLTGDNAGYQRMVHGAVQQTRQLEGQVRSTNGVLRALGAGLAGGVGLVAGMGAVQAVKSVTTSAVSLAAQAESTQVSFAVMMRDAGKAQKLVSDLEKLAASTPLETSSLLQASKVLMQFGLAGDKVLPTLRMLGDVTGGDAERLQAMALATGQMTAAGRLMGQDLLQMINAGFNPLQTIAGQTGKTMMQLREEMERGLITTEQVMSAFQAATSGTGQFAGMMEKRSKTLEGLWSTLRDNVALALREVGAAMIQGFGIKDIVRDVGTASQAFKEWVRSIDLAAQFRKLREHAETAWSWIKPTLRLLGQLPLGLTAIGVAAVALGSKLQTLSLAAGGLKTTLGVGLALGVSAFLNELTGANSQMDRFNRRLERTRKLAEEAGQALADSMAKTQEQTFARLGAISDPGTRSMATFDEMLAAEKEMKAAEKTLAIRREQMRIAENAGSQVGALSFFPNLVGLGDITGQQRQMASLFQQAEAGANEASIAFDAAKKRLDALREAYLQRGDSSSFLERLQAVATQAKDAVAGLFGEFAARGQAAAADVAKFTEELRLQAATLGMTAEQVEVYRLSLQGATGAQLAQAKQLIEIKTRLEQHQQLMEEGKRITEQFATPQQKAGKEIDNLNKLLDEGAIGFDVYKKAVAEVQKNLDATGKTAEKVAGGMRGIQATAYNSWAAADKVADYVDRLRDVRDQGKHIPLEGVRQFAPGAIAQLPQVPNAALPPEVQKALAGVGNAFIAGVRLLGGGAAAKPAEQGGEVVKWLKEIHEAITRKPDVRLAPAQLR